MASTFDYRDSSRGVYVDVNFMLIANTSYLAANNLFYGSGGVSGTYSYFDTSLQRTVTFPTGMGQSGVISFGDPIDVFYRDMPGIEAPASFDASQDFTGITGGQIGTNEGVISAYFRLFGIAMPTLTWDNTASGPTSSAASAEFEANLQATAADYLAQLQAVLDTTVRNSIDMVDWGQTGSAEQPGYVMHFTPDENTSLTYGDLFEVFQDQFGRTTLFARYPDAGNNLGNLFGPDETVDIILTGRNDTVGGSAFGPGETNAFAAGTVNIDAGAGNDAIFLFLFEEDILPQRITIDGGSGADTIEVGAWFDTQINGGSGDDRIDLTYGLSDVVANHTLDGGGGNDVIIGADRGNNTITAGKGADILYGGNGTDVIGGGTGNDAVFGYGGNDNLRGNDGADTITGGKGNDTLAGGAGNDTLYGDDASIFNRNGNDLIFGGDGNDTILGETGIDTIDGGTGNDTISGGAGLDTFVFGPASGRDIVNDYQRGEAVRIDAALWSGTVADFVATNVFVNGSGILTIRFSDVDRVQLFTTRAIDPADFTDVISFI